MPDRFVTILSKPIEYWILIVAIAAYLIRGGAALPWWSKLTNGLISAGLGVALSDALAPWTFGDERWAVAIIMLAGTSVMTIISTMFGDREFWRTEGRAILRDYLRKRVGIDPVKDNADVD
ncbi:hypothetical protein AL035_15585 [Salipiger aestuarii]|uniref:Holin n=1 Tax=Salipiger aestuarii TaxID=568098 RepID=A0A327YW46_9RHOB|nr:hypothetical protein [Salipiger aestuarii]KAB2540799.1 hypothetical protein AL035_15585 [Salipiger aestuarii]RAK24117.1 hypothetical protein ATI53_1001224 [Salipiger aestuarii]